MKHYIYTIWYAYWVFHIHTIIATWSCNSQKTHFISQHSNTPIIGYLFHYQNWIPSSLRTNVHVYSMIMVCVCVCMCMCVCSYICIHLPIYTHKWWHVLTYVIYEHICIHTNVFSSKNANFLVKFKFLIETKLRTYTMI